MRLFLLQRNHTSSNADFGFSVSFSVGLSILVASTCFAACVSTFFSEGRSFLSSSVGASARGPDFFNWTSKPGLRGSSFLAGRSHGFFAWTLRIVGISIAVVKLDWGFLLFGRKRENVDEIGWEKLRWHKYLQNHETLETQDTIFWLMLLHYELLGSISNYVVKLLERTEEEGGRGELPWVERPNKNCQKYLDHQTCARELGIDIVGGGDTSLLFFKCDSKFVHQISMYSVVVVGGTQKQFS